MNFLAAGCTFRRTPVELRERLAFSESQLAAALTELTARYGCEAVVLGTCNRVEFYLAKPSGEFLPDAPLVAEFLEEVHHLPAAEVHPHLDEWHDTDAIRHLFRVAASLDSLIVGEGQIAGQVRQAFDLAQRLSATGPFLNTLFAHALRTAKRVRTETGVARGHVSISSVAVDYVRQVFDHFGDKTVLVIGAGKMAGLTLKHLRDLKPQRIVVTNRSFDRAEAVAAGCGGTAVPFEKLDEMLAHADIVLSTTGAPEPIVTRERYERVRARRGGRPVVILDIAVPRDFDPSIHDGDTTTLINVDDLKRTVDVTLGERRKHLPTAESIIAEETREFLHDWSRRRHGPVIESLTREFDAKRQAVLRQLLARLNGKLSEADVKYIEGAFQLFQNQLLHGPIRAMKEASRDEGHGHHLLDALRKLFRLQE